MSEICFVEWCDSYKRNNKCPYCERHYRQFLSGGIRHTQYDPNIIIVENSKALVLLRNKKGVTIASVIISLEDIEEIKKYIWWYDHGYARCRYGYMHQVLCSFPKEVDHKNGDGLDNRRSNLRECLHTQNGKNITVVRKNNTSGYKGVCKSGNRWAAYIQVNGKTKSLKTWKTKEIAAGKYNDAAVKYFGEFANLNQL